MLSLRQSLVRIVVMAIALVSPQLIAAALSINYTLGDGIVVRLPRPSAMPPGGVDLGVGGFEIRGPATGTYTGSIDPVYYMAIYLCGGYRQATGSLVNASGTQAISMALEAKADPAIPSYAFYQPVPERITLNPGGYTLELAGTNGTSVWISETPLASGDQPYGEINVGPLFNRAAGTPHGAISPAPHWSDVGSSLPPTSVTPDAGYAFSHWLAVPRLNIDGNGNYIAFYNFAQAVGHSNPLTSLVEGMTSGTQLFYPFHYRLEGNFTPVSWTVYPVMGLASTVTVNSTGDGSVNPSGASTIAQGGQRQLTATPAARSYFVSWSKTGNGTFIGNTSNPVITYVHGTEVGVVTATFANALQTAQITPEIFDQSTSTLVSSSMAASVGSIEVVSNGAKNADGSIFIVNGASMKATAATGYRFSHWSGPAAASIANTAVSPATIVEASDGALRANFIRTYVVTASVSAGGSVNKPGDTTVDDGSTFALTAAPSPGFFFVGWRGNHTSFSSLPTNSATAVVGAIKGSVTPATTTISFLGGEGISPDLSVTIAANTTLVAIFAPTPTPRYTLTATPLTAYEFDRWEVSSGSLVQPATSASNTVTGWGEITATGFFRPILYPVVITASGDGTTDKTGTQMVAYDSTFTVSASQQSLPFLGWSGDLPSNVTATRSIENSLAMASTIGGSTAPSGIINRFYSGTDLSFVISGPVMLNANFGTPIYHIVATPNAGYRFDQWTAHSGAVVANPVASTTNVTGAGALSVTASFTPIVYHFTVTSTGNGAVGPASGDVRAATTTVLAEPIVVSATPAFGNIFQGWTSPQWVGVKSENPLSYSPTEDTAIAATFIPGTFTLTTTLVREDALGSRTPLGTSESQVPALKDTLLPDPSGSSPVGYVFGSWEISPAELGYLDAQGKQWIRMTADVTATAIFKPQVSLTVTTVGPGATSVSQVAPTSYYADGSTVTIQVIPSSSARFERWSGPDRTKLQPTNNPLIYTLRMSGNLALTATFIAKPKLTITALHGSTDIPTDATYDFGQLVTFTVSPDTPYVFDSWGGPDAAQLIGSGGPTASIRMDKDMALTANFSRVQHQLTVTMDAGGSASPATGNFDKGSRVSIAATADSGFVFAGWTGPGALAIDNTLSASTMITMTGPLSVTATFAPTVAATTLGIILQPAAAADVCFWRITNVATGSSSPWRASADTVTNLTPGEYILQFTPIDGYLTPSIPLTLGSAATVTRTVSFFPTTNTSSLGILDRVKLTASPNAGFIFGSWGGRSMSELQSTSATSPKVAATLVIDGPKEISASFAGREFTLTTKLYDVDLGAIIPSAPYSGTFGAGTEVLLQATVYPPAPIGYNQVKNGIVQTFAGPDAGTVHYNGSGFLGTAINQSINLDKDKELWIPYHRLYALNITFDPVGSGSATWKTFFSTGPVTGTPEFIAGESRDISITPAVGYAFSRWDGADLAKVPQVYASTTGVGPFDRDLNVTVRMEAKTYSLTTKVMKGSTLVSTTTASHPANSTISVPLPARPAGHIFDHWGTNTEPSASMAAAAFAVSLTSDTVVTCHFIPGYRLTVVASPAAAGTTGLSVNGVPYTGPVDLPLARATLLGSTIPGYAFQHWHSGGAPNPFNPLSLQSQPNDITMTGVYIPVNYTLTINTVNGAQPVITATYPSQTVVHLAPVAGNGGSASVNVAPAPGYIFDYWSGANVKDLVEGEIKSTKFNPRFTSSDPTIVMTGNKTITVNFSPAIPITLTSSQGGVAAIDFIEPPRRPPSAQVVSLVDAAGRAYTTIQYAESPFFVPEGQAITVMAHFFPGYQFSHWEGLPQGLDPKLGFYLLSVTEPLNLKAVFVETASLVDLGNSTGTDPLLNHAVLWYQSSTLPDVPDGTPLSAWTDSSGNNRTALQPVASLRPTVVTSPAFNYQRVARFNGQGATMTFPLINKIRVLFVVAQSQVSDTRNIFGHTTHKVIYAGDASQLYVSPFGGVSYRNIGPSLAGAGSDPAILKADAWRNSEYFGYQNEGSVLQMTSTTSQAVYTFSANGFFEANQITGQPENGSYWQGDYAEIIAFDRQLMLSEIYYVQNYLYNKYTQQKYLYQTRSYGGSVTTYGFPQLYNGWFADFSAQANGRAMPISAMPKAGFDFVGWSGDSEAKLASVSSAETTVRIQTDPTHVHATFVEQPASAIILPAGTSDAVAIDFLSRNIHAVFRQIDVPHSDPLSDTLPYSLLPSKPVLASNAGVYAGATAQRASFVDLTVESTATRAAGYVFSHWSGASASLLPNLTSPAVRLPLDPGNARELYANFAIIANPAGTSTIMTSTDGGGTVSPTPGVTNLNGTAQTFTATANPGNVFAYWSGSHASRLSNYLDANTALVLSGNGTLRAHFKGDQIMLAVVSGIGGTTTPAGNNLFLRDSVQTVTATPDAGYSFAFWSGDVAPADATNPVLAVTVDTAKTVKANFRVGYVVSDMFGLTIKRPTENWLSVGAALAPSILAGNAWPQRGTAVATGNIDILPNWLKSASIDGTPVAEWRRHYWTHLVGTDDDVAHNLPASMVDANATKLAPIPYLTLTINTVPAESIRFDFPVVEVAEDPVVLDVPNPGMLYIPGPQTPEDFATNRYFVLATANGLPSPTSVDGVKDRPSHTADVPGQDQVPGNEDTFRLTASHPANLAEINNVSLAARDMEVTPASAKMYVQIGADGQHIEFNPPTTYTAPVRITYYATLTRGTGLVDPENMRTIGLARHYVAADGNSSMREPCWKNAEGYITCWGQLTLKASGSNATDPMQLGSSVRATAPRSGDFTALYNRYINDVYPGGERISGVSAYYILRTIACYFIPGKVATASVAYQCEGDQTAFNTTAGSTLCADPLVNGYQRCIDGSCDWYAYVPANVSCQPVQTTSGNWDSVAGQNQDGTSSFISLVGTTVQMNQVLASGVQTCVKLPCPKRTANCTP